MRYSVSACNSGNGFLLERFETSDLVRAEAMFSEFAEYYRVYSKGSKYYMIRIWDSLSKHDMPIRAEEVLVFNWLHRQDSELVLAFYILVILPVVFTVLLGVDKYLTILCR